MLLVLGTRNRKKEGELRDLLGPLGLEVRSLADFPQAIDVVEDGATFADNARKKAVEQARVLHQWVLGEDSGLSVDALGGAPGVYSARFAGTQGDDAANNRKLVAELANVPLEQRTAHYVCYAVLSDPTGAVRFECQGRCQGRMRLEPAGTGGFGYDPYFEVLEYHATFGELGPTVKQALSHRGRALRQLVPVLARLAGETRGAS